jgi:hypothetical protein
MWTIHIHESIGMRPVQGQDLPEIQLPQSEEKPADSLRGPPNLKIPFLVESRILPTGIKGAQNSVSRDQTVPKKQIFGFRTLHHFIGSWIHIFDETKMRVANPYPSDAFFLGMFLNITYPNVKAFGETKATVVHQQHD